jgi:4-alpha-glucanotransferase
MEEGLLTRSDIGSFSALPEDHVDFPAVDKEKEKLFRKAYEKFRPSDAFYSFCDSEKYWLDDYALYKVIKNGISQKAWNAWDVPLKLRYPAALGTVKQFEEKEIRYHKFLQFVFHSQWAQLKAFANGQGIGIIGDVPVYVALDSADSWSSPDYFEFDENCNPIRVAGVPPDYFSVSGQLWGNPLYKWDFMKEDGYSWWISRIKKTLQLVDVIRLDHFRGFESFWAVPAGRTDAVKGDWVQGPGIDFFNHLKGALGNLPLIAEDLGNITPQVIGLRVATGIPGMKVLQFAFDGDPTNWHLPYNIISENIVYTGTHDNDTTRGWFTHLPDNEKAVVLEYLNSDELDIVDDFVRTAYASPAHLCVVPLQDVFGLDSSYRMNTPGTTSGNWQWRCTMHMMSDDLGKLDMIGNFAEVYGRQAVLKKSA